MVRANVDIVDWSSDLGAARGLGLHGIKLLTEESSVETRIMLSRKPVPPF